MFSVAFFNTYEMEITKFISVVNDYDKHGIHTQQKTLQPGQREIRAVF